MLLIVLNAMFIDWKLVSKVFNDWILKCAILDALVHFDKDWLRFTRARVILGIRAQGSKHDTLGILFNDILLKKNVMLWFPCMWVLSTESSSIDSLHFSKYSKSDLASPDNASMYKLFDNANGQSVKLIAFACRVFF